MSKQSPITPRFRKQEYAGLILLMGIGFYTGTRFSQPAPQVTEPIVHSDALALTPEELLEPVELTEDERFIQSLQEFEAITLKEGDMVFMSDYFTLTETEEWMTANDDLAVVAANGLVTACAEEGEVDIYVYDYKTSVINKALRITLGTPSWRAPSTQTSFTLSEAVAHIDWASPVVNLSFEPSLAESPAWIASATFTHVEDFQDLTPLLFVWLDEDDTLITTMQDAISDKTFTGGNYQHEAKQVFIRFMADGYTLHFYE